MAVGGGAAGHYASRRQFEAMSAAEGQQAQIDQAQRQAAQAQAQAPSQSNKDTVQEIERLGNLKKQGLITDEEFQRLKMQILSGI
jgi:multidrug resistance efflux pump